MSQDMQIRKKICDLYVKNDGNVAIVDFDMATQFSILNFLTPMQPHTNMDVNMLPFFKLSSMD